MIMCSRCHKRPAVVFITTMNGTEQKNEGLCMLCAKKLNIPQVKEYMDKLGITEEDIDMISEQMMEFADGDSFEHGGSETLPDFMNTLLSAENKDSNKENLGDLNENKKPDKASSSKNSRKEKAKSDKEDKNKNRHLKAYCTNLTEKAEKNELDNVIGRDREISRVIQILSRRTKNNPCLIGEPGVGKTAIAEGIAQRIARGDVPFNIANKKVHLLDLTALVAGTQFRGQFESRVKGLIDEVKEEGNIILFIDEVHNLVGTGDSEGTMNAANILKPALSRGVVQVIGATTFKEYRKYIEKDTALERRFQPVIINEPTISETIDVLKGIKKYYENYHKVRVSDNIVGLCATLSERYINDRFLPDKAIDLLDESCACASIKSVVLIELSKLNKEVFDIEAEEKLFEGTEEPDFEKIAELKARKMRIKTQIDELMDEKNIVFVTENDLAKVIELWTGIPANKIAETEFTKMDSLENRIKTRIIGQDEAVELVAKGIKRTRIQLSKRRRPASFIFVGPTGVGKTELVKVIGEELFDATEPIIRLDMTEYMEKHSVSKITGSPPGYIGYDDAGQLTEKVRRRPYSVILFDEIEKAHPDVLNLLLQILDEGKLTDAQGRNINFENTVICMTSNAGSTDKATGVGFNKTDNQVSKEKAMKGLKDFLRPEFISRIEEIVAFNPLTQENYERIAALMLDEMKQPLAEKDIEMSYNDDALAKIAKLAYGGKYGARDIRRVIRKEIEDRIATIIIENGNQEIKSLEIVGEPELAVKRV